LGYAATHDEPKILCLGFGHEAQVKIQDLIGKPQDFVLRRTKQIALILYRNEDANTNVRSLVRIHGYTISQFVFNTEITYTRPVTFGNDITGMIEQFTVQSTRKYFALYNSNKIDVFHLDSTSILNTLEVEEWDSTIQPIDQVEAFMEDIVLTEFLVVAKYGEHMVCLKNYINIGQGDRCINTGSKSIISMIPALRTKSIIVWDFDQPSSLQYLIPEMGCPV
jgi:hypothetical protein